jgi:hypothetical protein
VLIPVDFVVPTPPGQATVPNWNGDGLDVAFFSTGPNTASAVFTQENNSGTFGASPNVAVFTDLGPGHPTFTNVVLASASPDWNVPANVSFNSQSFGFDFGGLAFQPGDSLTLEITGLAAVPEPASVTLLGIGTAGMAWYVWRRRKRSVTA